jgi:regulator of protease activity HflC (stomatin/prohibitin superfamily)
MRLKIISGRHQIGEERDREDELERVEAEQEAAVNALRAAGVSAEIIEKAYPNTRPR